jgi:multidrug efflux pump subunit AcrA (membrane-fusion protein)
MNPTVSFRKDAPMNVTFRPTNRDYALRSSLVLTLAAAVALLAACGGPKQQRRMQPAVPVAIGKVVEKTVPLTFRAIGHVEPISTVAVKARIGGELQKVWFVEGHDVRAGQTLFTIDPRQYDAALRQAEAQLAKDQALVKKANADVQRYAQLVKQDFVTKQDSDRNRRVAARDRGFGSGERRQRKASTRVLHDNLAARGPDRQPRGQGG